MQKVLSSSPAKVMAPSLRLDPKAARPGSADRRGFMLASSAPVVAVRSAVNRSLQRSDRPPLRNLPPQAALALRFSWRQRAKPLSP